MEAIAIIGMGCRFPNAQDPESFWTLLRDGVDTITEVPPERWNVDAFYDPEQGTPGKTVSRWGGFLEKLDHFDPNFFEISESDARRIDPHQRLVLEVAWESLENAGIVPTKLTGTQTGVFIGMSQSDHNRLIYQDVSDIDADDGVHTFLCLSANRLSYFLNLQGPSLVIDTACSSSLVAVHYACQSLRSGECNLALAGGVSLRLSPEEFIALSHKGMLSAQGRCKTFDASADGYVRGEGCGVVVLKRLSDALKDGDNILATIRGSAVNQNGLSHGITSPNGLAQQNLISQALEDAVVAPKQISYVEIHGTASSLGDAIEFKALKAVLMTERSPNQPCWLGSVKTNIGHLEAAAGIASLIKVVLSMQHKEIPPNLHLKQLNPYISLKETAFSIPTERQSWNPEADSRLAGVSSFGFGGTNCHAILEEAPVLSEELVSKIERPLHILTLSAKTEKALKELTSRYVERLQNSHFEVSLADICFTANTGRAHFDYRLAVVAESNETLSKQLEAFASGKEIVGLVKGQISTRKQPKIVFLFPGQGSQYVGMGRQLYENQPTFRASLNRCNEILRPYLEKPLLEVLYPEPGETSPIDETAYTQPALFALEYALAELWKSWGIEPDAVMGYSLGEYVAACIAGVFSLEDALKLVAQRGRLMQSLPQNGAMVEVFADGGRVQAAVELYSEKVAIAAINSPEHIIISGELEAVEAVITTLQTEGIKTRKLKISSAFHSPLMEPIVADFEKVASEVTYSSPQLDIISNVTSENATAEIATPGYWCRHTYASVRLTDSMNTLHQKGYEVFVEIGPQSLLLEMARQCLPEGVGVWLPSLRQGQEDWQQILESLGTLYVEEVSVDWSGFDKDYSRRRRSLPTYPFERQRCWFKTDTNHFYPTSSLQNGASTQVPSLPQSSSPVIAELKSNIQLETPTKSDVQYPVKNGSANSHQRISTQTTESIQNWIVAWLGRKLNLDAKSINPSKSGKSLLDYGLKSLGAVELAKDLEKWLGRSLDATIVWNFPTIESLALHLAGEIDIPISTQPLKCEKETASVFQLKSLPDRQEMAAVCAKLEAPSAAKISASSVEEVTEVKPMSTSSPGTQLSTQANGSQSEKHPESQQQQEADPLTQPKCSTAKQGMQFSLLYFSSDEAEFTSDKYRLFLEGAKFADKYGFKAVWIPERHFHAFGGLYPNPSVLGSALAMVTERIRIGAGSVVLPLQNPIRVAEEWAVVDNLSQGRVDIAFARGWNPNDFVLSPDNFSNSREVMFSGIKTVQKLWRRESISLPNGVGQETEIRIYPLPKQREIPIWITCTGGKERFIEAGAIGANVLTALLFQPIEELAEKIALYRQSRVKHGHDPDAGQVTLMLHTFIAEDLDFVRHKVRQPFTAYLKSSVNLWRQGIKSLDGLDEKEKEHLLAYAFERYFQTSALMGTPDTCLQMVGELKAVGVDEIACLIDFGIDADSVMASLYSLKKLKEQSELIGVPSLADVSGRSLTVKEKTPANSQTRVQPSHKGNWIIEPQRKPDAPLRLFCLPYAGGNTSVFRHWSDGLPPEIEVYAIELPKNPDPKSKPPFEYLSPLVEDLAEFLLPYLDRAFAFYGHSLGALINFELCRHLRRAYHLKPVHFFVGAQHAPQLPYPYPGIDGLTHSELLEFIKNLTTIELPESIEENNPFLQLLLASLKAGSRIQKEKYTYIEEEPLDCPITAFGGMQDKFLSQEHLSAWQVHTNSSFKLQVFSGNHLFLTSHKEQLLQAISQELQ